MAGLAGASKLTSSHLGCRAGVQQPGASRDGTIRAAVVTEFGEYRRWHAEQPMVRWDQSSGGFTDRRRIPAFEACRETTARRHVDSPALIELDALDRMNSACASLPEYPGGFSGRGIVIPAGRGFSPAPGCASTCPRSAAIKHPRMGCMLFHEHRRGTLLGRSWDAPGILLLGHSS
jgi:hypothetical protein